MDSGVAYLFAIIFFVIVLNFFFIFKRMGRGKKRRRMDRTAIDEAKQALWREKEVARRIQREQSDALERVKLRNETLALYEVVRQRHAKKDRLEQLGLEQSEEEENPYPAEWSSYYSEYESEMHKEPKVPEVPERVEMIDLDMDPFDIFKNNK